MAIGHQDQDGIPDNLRKQLAIAVKGIQWSYAIFWSTPVTQPGVLEWSDGYYNGDIKTRKTVQAGEVNEDQLGLQRTEQLKELYSSLLTGESEEDLQPQAKRPSAALSPEDLTDTEWYFLVCMSFVFNVGQGLPGKALATNQTIWLCNAHQAESRVFSRSLLAKSASIQTVVCFPYLGGVIELGVTELVLEDPDLIQQIKNSFLEVDHSIISKGPNNAKNDTDVVSQKLDHNVLESDAYPVEINNSSPDDSSNGFVANQETEDSLMVVGVIGETSQAQSWKFMDDNMSNGATNSLNSSDCISQNNANCEKLSPLWSGEKATKPYTLDRQEHDQRKLHLLDHQGDDAQYQAVLSTLLKSSDQLTLGPHFRNINKKSSFAGWKTDIQTPRLGTAQKLLKKVLLEVPRMHGGVIHKFSRENRKKNSLWRPEVDDIDTSRVISERRRREKINERFMHLASMLPTGGKVDKISLLDETIEYMKELERRVQELEARSARRSNDTAEQTSDNCGTSKFNDIKGSLPNKRKACDMDEVEPESCNGLLKGSSANSIVVNMIDKEVSIKMSCLWSEGLLLKIMEALTGLQMDCHTVQSSNIDGVLSIAIESKSTGSKTVAVGTIREALQRVVWKS
ncbi:transcription factor EGL1 [Lycium barbarum]|uniref:transcription factor EGL1 n=1 Tax=Lycium barbarum TaxID=112863 RepID=UPI00293E90DB|nr:transcription factor EGL1 [Lycium barbarum]XP_060207057.1 transcription factor EGL1 [Lycium barbarum]XP_060207058.1 transcription factor EGL1 [Lycium barbarum]